jgi:Na+/proline symporter
MTETKDQIANAFIYVAAAFLYTFIGLCAFAPTIMAILLWLGGETTLALATFEGILSGIILGILCFYFYIRYSPSFRKRVVEYIEENYEDDNK